MIFDTHVHYDDRRFDEDREAVLNGLAGEGVLGAVNIGCDFKSSEAGRALSERFSFLYFAAGIYPDNVNEAEELGEEAALGRLKALLLAPKAVAVGEIGLDYHGFDIWPDKPKAELQQKWFRLQAGLAREMGKPIVIHSRDAAADTLSLVRGELRDQPKVLHCFSYSKEVAAQCLDAGAYLGIGGVVTFKNGRKMKDVVEYMPADRLLLETDCPYLAPEPFRGRRNQSGYLLHVVRQIAQIRGMTPEEVEKVTWENAVKFYGIKASPLGEAVTAVGRD